MMEGGGVLTAERSSARANLHVAFTEKGEVKERREKFLTAKYGSHQMSLIRKRLAVEMWLFDELEKLYESVNDSGKNQEVEIDIDELLDMDSDDHRRRFLQELLVDTKKPPHDVNKFINDLLEKAKTL
ncbi:protein phosphatase 1 regulatory subunit 14B isoform X1 [Colletes latitarsis]|uniref:protein phosphatase 1 regulatory subunit 14B isoform X1 n=1 Tax=Colletes gigas TaxID=935657 RepID=UPI001C9A5798|nr:protein phosphatase 1 regulatory subunit 14B isoform X1 [Colletes gigas]XP_043259257.1 protein phosphatase 1 regulatory subunit 14B isoform X1 [Colletes gigas]XP_043259258.1 protein phosphatase 1 regulatory subunit 14B isoform X1 [Colletes gigas]